MLPLRAAFFLFHGSVKKLFLQQTVDILRQAFTVVEGHILRNRKIGYGPLIDVILTVLMIKVQIDVINRSCHRPGHWIQRADGPVAQNGRDYKDRRVGSSAGVAAEIDDHIFHGAVLAHDLLIGIEHDTDGVFCLLGRRCFVIIDPRRDAGKVIEGNIGRIADLFLWKDKLT